jgi:hypothetical protein
MTIAPQPRKAARPRPRCTHCGERLDESNTPMRFEWSTGADGVLGWTITRA